MEKEKTKYRKAVNKLRKKYPGRHISISITFDYYDHTDRHEITHYIYVAEKISKYIQTLPELEKYVQSLCKKEDENGK